MNEVSIPLNTAVRLRSMVGDFNATIRELDEVLRTSPVDWDRYQRIRDRQASLGYQLTGAIEGSAICRL